MARGLAVLVLAVSQAMAAEPPSPEIAARTDALFAELTRPGSR
jgi:hypothetical protein